MQQKEIHRNSWVVSPSARIPSNRPAVDGCDFHITFIRVDVWPADVLVGPCFHLVRTSQRVVGPTSKIFCFARLCSQDLVFLMDRRWHRCAHGFPKNAGDQHACDRGELALHARDPHPPCRQHILSIHVLFERYQVN